MKDKYKNIDDVFKSRLGEFSPPPPDDIWDNIAPHLETKKRLFLPVWKVAASIAVIAAAFVGLIYTNNAGNDNLAENKNVLSKVEAISDDPQSDIITDNKSDESNKNFREENNLVEQNNSIPKDIPFIKEDVVEEEINEQSVQDESLFIASLTKKDESSQTILLASINGVEGSMNVRDYNYEIKENNFGFNNENDNIKEGEEKKSFWDNVIIGGQFSPTTSSTNAFSANPDMGETPLNAFSGGIYLEKKVTGKFSMKAGAYFMQYGGNSNVYIRPVSTSNIVQESSSYLAMAVVSDEVRNDAGYMIIGNSIGTIELSGGGASENMLLGDANVNGGATDRLGDTRVLNQLSTNEKGADLNTQGELVRTDINVTNKLYTLEIPMMFRYRFFENQKLSLNAISGVSANIIMKDHTFSSSSELNANFGGINMVNFSGSFALGFELPVSGALSLSVEPTIKYFFNSINSSDAVANYDKVYPYSLGLYTGLSYAF